MSLLAWWLSIIGLLISIIGSIFLYFGTPFDTGGIHMFAFGDIEAPQKEKRIRLRRKLSQSGFILLLVGFIIQFISMFLQKPN